MEDHIEFEDDESFFVQPYMFEPERMAQVQLSSDDDTESEDDQENVHELGQERLGNVNWCECNSCSPMTTAAECKCCQEFSDLVEKLDGFACITQHPGFIGNCLNRDVVEVSFFEFLQVNGPIGDEEPVHEAYRYVAYRRLARWIWHRLSKYDRRVLPACAVTSIRQTFPSEVYTGFKYVREI